MNFLRGFLDNNSFFGRIMGRCGLLIGANLLFIVCSIPVVSFGAAFAALHYTVMRALRGKGQPPLFKTFWKGLKDNWKQATAVWLGMLVLAAVLALELFWCSQFTGPMAYFRYCIMALMVVELAIGLYIFPTMAAFRATIPQLIKDSIFFAIQRPLNLIQVLFISIVPFVLTYTFTQLMPLFAFLWAMAGFAAVVMCCDTLLLRQFLPYLPPVDAAGDIITEAELNDPNIIWGGDGKKSGDDEARTLDEMRKYGL